jgi:hypothetical protein
MRFLSGDEKQKLVQIAEKIVDGPNGSVSNGKVFVPDMLVDDNTLSLKSWAKMRRSEKVFYIFINICADIHCNKGGYEKLMNKPPKVLHNDLGRSIWDSSLATANANFSKKAKNRYEDWTVVNTYSGAGDVNLSKDIYKFQHYAEFSEIGEASPVAADPGVRMRDKISGEVASGAIAANRDGILGNRTMKQLEAMVNSGFTQVSTNAVPIATAGAELAKKLTDALSWASLDLVKASPDAANVPSASEAIDCRSIATSILLQPGSETLFPTCVDYIKSLRAGSGSGSGSGSGQQASAATPRDMTNVFKWLPGLQKMPGFPGVPLIPKITKMPDLSPKVIEWAMTPKPPATEQPLPFPDGEPTEGVASSEEDLPEDNSDELDEEMQRIKDELAEAQKKAKAGGKSSATGSGSSKGGQDGGQVMLSGKAPEKSSSKKWLWIGLAVAASGGLAYYLLSKGKSDTNEYGQPLQQYDENGVAILAYNQDGKPLQQYDEDGKAVPMFDVEGKQIQLYDEDSNPIAKTTYANANVSVSNKSMANITAINSNANKNKR